MDAEDTFDVAMRVRLTVPEGVPQGAIPWGPWKTTFEGLSPREAKGEMVLVAAYWMAQRWEVIGLNRAEITLESPTGRRMEVRMRKERGGAHDG